MAISVGSRPLIGLIAPAESSLSILFLVSQTINGFRISVIGVLYGSFHIMNRSNNLSTISSFRKKQ